MTKIYMILLIMVVFNLISCTQEKYNHNRSLQYEVASEAMPFIREFEIAAKLNGHPLIVNDLIVVLKEDSFFSNSEIARCTLWTANNEPPTISIKASYWNKRTTSHYNKRELMFHELGHCVLKLKHNDKKDLADYPVSVMNRYHMGDNLYNETTVSSYDTELFTGRNPTTIGE